MMAHLDAIIHVLECHDPVPNFVRAIARWEDVFEDLDDSPA